MLCVGLPHRATPRCLHTSPSKPTLNQCHPVPRALRNYRGLRPLVKRRLNRLEVKASPNTASFHEEHVLPKDNATTSRLGAKSRNATMPRACIAQDATSKEPVPSRPDRTWGRSDSWTKERSLDASALHPTCQTISHRGARIFPSDQHAPGYVRPGFGLTDDSLESPPRHGKTLHTSMGWLEKALGEAPMAHHPDPPWCKGRQPASPPYNRLICQNAPCTSGYPFC
ncbi:hypothetical protein RIF29_48622 [Crotalaria pallida]|uniref:Uncharacterized protein n=1 Tax=Crotalaria pallida TaxID=3830 RepID=A0AAN9DRS0_CROPI